MLEIYENRKDIGYIHVASCNFFTDAISISILRGKGVEIRYGHSEDNILWVVPEKYDYRNKGIMELDNEEELVVLMLAGIAKIKTLEQLSRRQWEDLGPDWIDGKHVSGSDLSRLKALNK